MRPNSGKQDGGRKAERRYPLRMPEGWNPPVPAWKSTFPTQSVAMTVIGIQHGPDTNVTAHLAELSGALSKADIRDFATCDAGEGMCETVCIAYWTDGAIASADLASPAFGAAWEKHARADAGYGLFREMTNIPLERSETLFSGPVHDHGMSQIRNGIEGPIVDHQYWGGMRDRIPISANDPLEAGGPLRIVEQSDNRVVVEAHENLCIIRSGQDWSQCEGEQLREYQDVIEPTLKAGMAFLRDQGSEVSCYTCRYMRDQDSQGRAAPRSFGLAYFRTMRELEDWAEHHPTHLEIFNTFLQIAPKYGPNLQLRLWHEVSVLPAGKQRAEYINCRAGTGLLGGVDR
ncbi:MAG: phenylacetaldoxime dehydratase family protein [Stappiaceae bacterium]